MYGIYIFCILWYTIIYYLKENACPDVTSAAFVNLKSKMSPASQAAGSTYFSAAVRSAAETLNDGVCSLPKKVRF